MDLNLQIILEIALTGFKDSSENNFDHGKWERRQKINIKKIKYASKLAKKGQFSKMQYTAPKHLTVDMYRNTQSNKKSGEAVCQPQDLSKEV